MKGDSNEIQQWLIPKGSVLTARVFLLKRLGGNLFRMSYLKLDVFFNSMLTSFLPPKVAVLRI